MKIRPIKKISKLMTALALGAAFLFTGCSAFQLFGNRAPELPDNPQSFKKQDTDSSGIVIEVNGRKYSPFGKLNGKLDNSSFRECLGYLDNDKNDRVYTLCEEPYDNYLVTKNINGIMEQPMFWRDRSTYGEDIFTPEYIVSDDDVYWGRSGCYHEMLEFRIRITLEADDVKELSMEYKGNGLDLGTCGVKNAVGGLKNPDGNLPLKRGEELDLSITELSLYGKLEKEKPFDCECRFFVESLDGKLHELDHVYKKTIKLGGKDTLTLTGNAKDGYKIG
ncbi:MAG: hypothetical protein E7386_00450 [Ruminococcaceae bacterium]|nr:hypothetical protein [Oscillospiraceae bacterium]